MLALLLRTSFAKPVGSVKVAFATPIVLTKTSSHPLTVVVTEVAVALEVAVLFGAPWTLIGLVLSTPEYVRETPAALAATVKA